MVKPNFNHLNQLALLPMLHIVAKAVGLCVELKLDKIITKTPKNIDQLAKKLKFHPQAMRSFLRILDAYEVVTLIEENKVKAGKLLPYLDRIKSPHILDSYQFMDNIQQTMRNNQQCYAKTFGKEFYPSLLEDKAKLEQFKIWCTVSAKDWLPVILTMYDFSKFNHIVDVGGGEGYFLASILKKNPFQAGVVLDLPGIVKQSAKTFKEYKVSSRAKAVGGDFFKPLPKGGDVYILCRVLLNWDDKDAVTIINNCHKAMKSGDTLLIIDFMIPEKVHPQYQAATLFNMNLLAWVSSAIRTKSAWHELISKSKFKLKKTYITKKNANPLPVIPMIILEAVA